MGASFIETLKSADVESEEAVVTECYILGNEDGSEAEIMTAAEFNDKLVRDLSMAGYDDEQLAEAGRDLIDVSKAVAGSRQHLGVALSGEKVVPPPYSPELMLAFMQIDDMVHRCVEAKAQDFVGREWQLLPVKPRKLTVEYDSEDVADQAINPDAADDLVKVHKFIQNCNEVYGFEGALLRAAKEYEGLGWAALEVVRNPTMEVVKLDPVPASRLRVLQGWTGFVEDCGEGKKVYYQPFGQKVVSTRRVNPLTNLPEPYDPEEDGELNVNNAQFSMIDYRTGEPTDSFTDSANEIVWIQKHHPSTIYYGVSDSLPATAHILANANIRSYLLQFFEHNTVPRYVVVIKGAKLDPSVQKTILDYFGTHIRGRAHKTLVLPIPSGRGNIEVTFEKLDSSPSDGWFKQSAEQASNSTRIAHGVPAAIATVSESASLGSGKGTAQSETYKDRVVSPAQKKWADIVTRIFKLGLGVTSICLKFTELDIRDQEAQMRILTQYMDRGVLTINQVLSKLGMPPKLGGDRAFIKTPKGPIFIDELPKMDSANVVNTPALPGGATQPNADAPKVQENSVDQVIDGKRFD